MGLAEINFLAGLPEELPQLGGVLVGGVDLIAQLAGVAGAGDHALHPLQVDLGQGGVVALGDLVLGEELLQDGRGLGALEGHLGHGVGDVLALGAGEDVGRHVGVILLPVGGVDHRQVALVPELVHHQIVDGAAVGVAHGPVADLVHRHAVVVVGEQVVDGVQGGGAGEEDLPHVGDIEQPSLLPHGHVLLDDAGAVLHRQQVAGEGDDLAALGHVDVIEWGFPFHFQHSFFFSR